MSKFHRLTKEDFLRLWERLVALHMQWKSNHSLQCAISIAKLVLKILFWWLKKRFGL